MSGWRSTTTTQIRHPQDNLFDQLYRITNWVTMRQSARTLVARAARALELQGVNTTTTSSSAQAAAPFAISARSFANDADLLKTPLYDFHVENGGGFGVFCPCLMFSLF